MSVVGESSECAWPLIEPGQAADTAPAGALAGNDPQVPLKVMSGMLLRKRPPPPAKTCGKTKPYVLRIQAVPTGGIRCPFHEAFTLASLISVGVSSQVCAS